MVCAPTLDKLLLWLKESELVIASSGTDVDDAADFGDAILIEWGVAADLGLLSGPRSP